MASQVKSPTQEAAQAAAEQRARKVQEYVNRQLEKTRKQVKTLDLFASLAGLVAFVIGFFLVAAVVDAWIWPFNTTGRFVVLGLLFLGIAAYSILKIFPLIMQRINPKYAAKMIEESTPSFKNSLLNYLSLRKEPENVRRAVYDAVARQAAKNLSEVPEESAVDRTNLINSGLVLVAICVAAVAYMMLSPKSPLSTIGRILSPATKIAKPSIVKILEVQPGDANVFFGEPLSVSAVIRGRHDANDVRIIYSTDDGQMVDQSIPMVFNDTNHNYEASVATDGIGIQQSLVYHVEAGDGTSPAFHVNVRPNPTISVQKAILNPPRYTKLPQRVIEGQGNLQAIEGTRVQIEAKANLDIRSARIELLAQELDRGDGSDFRVVKRIEMNPNEQSARGEFIAALNQKRDDQLFTHYRINFISTAGDQNNNANIYPIRITPDLAPEVIIVDPIKKEIALPINQTLAIDIQAADLDFEISSVDLHLDHKGTRLLDADVHVNTAKGSQKVTARQIIDPRQMRFEVGDTAVFYATAADNRTSPYSDEPDPNISRTENYTLLITEAKEQVVEPERENPQQGREKENPPQDQEQQQSDPQEKGQQQPEQENGGQKEGDQQEGQQGNKGEDQEGSQTGEQPESQGEDEGTEGQQGGGAGNKGEQGQESGHGEEGSQQSGNEGNEGTESTEGGEGSRQDGQGNSMQDGQGQQQDGQNQTGQGQRRDGDSNSPNNGQRATDGERGSAGDNLNGEQDGSLGEGEHQPLGDDASEGDVFERLQEELKKREGEQDQSGNQGQQQPGQEGQSGNQGQQQGEEGQSGNQGQQQPGQEGQSGNQGQQQGQEGQSGNQGQQQPGQEGQSGNQGQQQGQEGQSGNQGQQQPGQEGQSENQGQQGQEGQSGNQGQQQPGQEAQSGNQGQQQGEEGQSGNQGQQQPGQEGQSGNQGQQQGQEGQSGNQGQQQPGQEGQSGNQGQQQGEEGQSGNHGQQQPGQEGQSGNQGQQQGEEGQSGNQGQQQPGQGQQSGQPGQGQPGQGQQGAQGQPTGQPGSESSSTQDNGQAGEATGTSGGSGAGQGVGMGEEEANIEYAKQATDMILEKLGNEKIDPDPELLESINMTKEELRDFLDRWKQMKQKAESGSEIDRKRYQNKLRSLGLIPQAKDTRKVAGEKDELFGLAEDGAVNQPPPHLLERFNQFQRERSRVRDDE